MGTPPGAQLLDPFAHPSSGNQQYWHLTQHNQLHRKSDCSYQKSPFQPFTYIRHLTNARLVSALLRLRTQNSHVPSHVSSTGKYTPPTATYTRIEFRERFCPFCLPPRATWGLAAPPLTAPLGTEFHTLIQCHKFEEARTSLFVTLNSHLASRIIPRASLRDPWYILEPPLQLSSLLAVFPPSAWNLKLSQIPPWYAALDEHLPAFLFPYITLCAIAQKETQIAYAAL